MDYQGKHVKEPEPGLSGLDVSGERVRGGADLPSAPTGETSVENEGQKDDA